MKCKDKSKLSLHECVKDFQCEMWNKLQKQEEKGWTGWNDTSWTQSEIKQTLIDNIEKGDMVDVANYAMFLWNRKIIK